MLFLDSDHWKRYCIHIADVMEYMKHSFYVCTNKTLYFLSSSNSWYLSLLWFASILQPDLKVMKWSTSIVSGGNFERYIYKWKDLNYIYTFIWSWSYRTVKLKRGHGSNCLIAAQDTIFKTVVFKYFGYSCNNIVFVIIINTIICGNSFKKMKNKCFIPTMLTKRPFQWFNQSSF